MYHTHCFTNSRLVLRNALLRHACARMPLRAGDAKMRQLHSAILSGLYVAKEDWAVTIFLPMTNHDSKGKYYCTFHRRLFHKIICIKNNNTYS